MYKDFNNPDNRDGEYQNYQKNYSGYNTGGEPVMRPLDVEPVRKKKGGGFYGLKIAALALVCALAGGALGGVIVSSRLSAAEPSEQIVQTEQLSGETGQGSLLGLPSASASPLIVTTNKSGELTPSEVYSQNREAVVGIATEITATNIFGQAAPGASSGSGFIISSDGYIVTNYHVIEKANSVNVKLLDETTYPATVIGSDKENDIALLKVDATGLPYVSVGDSSQLQVGEMVMAIGNPLGELTSTLTVGYVSALDREINTDGSPINMLQTDAAINPGNSGGPLFDLKGNVIGITTAKYADTLVEGLGFAIPINDALSVVQELKENGYVTGRPSFGISVQDISLAVATYYNLPVGVYVGAVEVGSCAEAAGMREGDIITRLGDETIKSVTDLSAEKKNFKAGDTATVEVFRNTESIELTITFDEQKPATTERAVIETVPQAGGIGYAGQPQAEAA